MSSMRIDSVCLVKAGRVSTLHAVNNSLKEQIAGPASDHWFKHIQFNSLPDKLTMTLWCPVNQDSHFLPIDCRSVSSSSKYATRHQQLQWKCFINSTVGILFSIQGVSWDLRKKNLFKDLINEIFSIFTSSCKWYFPFMYATMPSLGSHLSWRRVSAMLLMKQVLTKWICGVTCQ